MDAARSLHELLLRPHVMRPASIFSPISAVMAERLGYESLMLAGSTASHHYIARADLLLMTATELTDLVRRITARVSTSLIVDADHGYGVPRNAARTVELLARAGAAAVTIEDTDLPSQEGNKAGLVSVDDGLSRIRAGVEAGRALGVSVIARTSAAAIAGEGEATKRLQAYSDAGCDLLMPVGPLSATMVEALYRSTGRPIMLSHKPIGVESDEHLVQLGVRILLTGHTASESSLRATYEALSEKCGSILPPWSAELQSEILGHNQD